MYLVFVFHLFQTLKYSSTSVNGDRLMMTEQAKLMAERAQNNHSFVYIKIPLGPRCYIFLLCYKATHKVTSEISSTHSFLQ